MRFSGSRSQYSDIENQTPSRSTNWSSLNPLRSSMNGATYASPPASFSTSPSFTEKLIANKTLISRVLVCGAILFVLWYALSDGNSSTSSGGDNIGAEPAWQRAYPLSRSTPEHSSYRVVIVADLDKKSKVAESKKPKWKSYLLEGELKQQDGKYEIMWGTKVPLTSSFGEAGRGMELSELAVFQERLWTFDDRSGLAFEITSDHEVIPRTILMEGDGNHGKGQKTEWATVQDGKLVVGSFGKEYVNSSNHITSTNNMWVSIIEPSGQQFSVSHQDWQDNYNALRDATNTRHPNYMIIEAIEWSDVHQRWFVLPRRVSEAPYDETLDESRGSNKVLSASRDFSDVKVWEAGTVIPTHGFSSFAFLPGSKDTVVAALKTEENEEKGTQTTHFMVFELLSGNVLMDEVEIPGNMKFEGLTFV